MVRNAPSSYYYHPMLHELLLQSTAHVLSLREASPVFFPEYIESVLFLEEQSYPRPQGWPILPDLSPYLMVQFFNNGSIRFILVGPRTKAVYINRSQRTLSVLLRFKPGGLPYFFNINPQELVNRSLHLTDIDQKAQELYDQLALLYEKGRYDKITEAIYSYLCQCLRESSSRKATGLFLANTPPKVKEWAKSLGLSERGLRKATYRHLGMKPKHVLQIQRLNNVIASLEKIEYYTWADLALQVDYYDQSHFIDEFGTFFGASPEQWLQTYFKEVV